MDAFDKLAKLAGASVESVGEGLPRTRAEAKALGAKWYFTGNPCKHGHVSDRMTSSRCCRECGKIALANCRKKPDTIEKNRQYYAKRNAKPEIKQERRIYMAKPENKDLYRRRGMEKTGDFVLFAINQSCRYATIGVAYADIVPQCPEPQRSQLQALVDRIKADPQAGKAVVGLLRTMRELRKAELAEMKSGVDA